MSPASTTEAAIELSEAEAALLRRLRTREQQWPMTRWLLLVLGAFNLFNGWREFGKGDDHAFAVLLVAIGILGLMKAVIDWRGNPTRVLLLKLLEPSHELRRLTR